MYDVIKCSCIIGRGIACVKQCHFSNAYNLTSVHIVFDFQQHICITIFIVM